jgi:hypothetical protein
MNMRPAAIGGAKHTFDRILHSLKVGKANRLAPEFGLANPALGGTVLHR